MCSIIGFSKKEGADLQDVKNIFSLATESKIRGLHAFGITFINSQGIIAKKWLEMPDFNQFGEVLGAKILIFHGRYSTSGDYKVEENNQPINYDGISVAVNGVISMKPKAEYEKQFGVNCISDNDAEIFLRKIQQGNIEEFINTQGISIASVFIYRDKLWAVRNAKRPLWTFQANGAVFFASTQDIIQRALKITPEVVPMFKIIEA
jgi:glutamine phosphoribosylpyrophosphate amidotransferase